MPDEMIFNPDDALAAAGDPRSRMSKWTRYLLDILIPILVMLSGWMLVNQYNMSVAQSEITVVQRQTSTAMTALVEAQKTLTESVAGLREWKAETSANRFTVQDGYELWKKIADIKERLAQMPTEVPPSWFVDQLNMKFSELDTRVDKLEDRFYEDRVNGGGK